LTFFGSEDKIRTLLNQNGRNKDILNLMVLLVVALVIVCFSGVFLAGFFVRKIVAEKQIGSAKTEGERILALLKEQGENEKKILLLEGKDEVFRFKQESEKEIAERRRDIQFQEKRIRQKEEAIERKFESAAEKEKNLEKKLKYIEEKLAEAEAEKAMQIVKLEEIAGFTREQAKEIIIARLQDELVHERGQKIKEYEQNLNEEKEEISRNILSMAIQRCAAEHICETAVSVVSLPNDEMKGRIIGREGRNIRAIETATGADIIIDDTPEAIAVSCFDPIRREIARRAIEWLVLDGRIHPAKIEEAVKRSEDEMDKEIKTAGQNTILEAGVQGIHIELVKLLGRLKYRTSYGQNVLSHSLETAQICGSLAAELGLDSVLAKRCGLLHDIGKALTHENEGAHTDLGAQFARRYKENEIVVNAIEKHHQNGESENIMTVLVQAADAVSAARPGARCENLENYVKRLQKLERIASDFDGVERCFAIQAGREVRVMINPEKISDDAMVILAREVCRKIESEMTYPGQVKVSVIRETKVYDYAK
jgi:ribonuclease Y